MEWPMVVSQERSLATTLTRIAATMLKHGGSSMDRTRLNWLPNMLDSGKAFCLARIQSAYTRHEFKWLSTTACDSTYSGRGRKLARIEMHVDINPILTRIKLHFDRRTDRLEIFFAREHAISSFHFVPDFSICSTIMLWLTRNVPCKLAIQWQKPICNTANYVVYVSFHLCVHFLFSSPHIFFLSHTETPSLYPPSSIFTKIVTAQPLLP